MDDARRAVRFVRHYASRFGIDPDPLGALGHSSGGYLVAMLGTMDGDGDPGDPDVVNRTSARVQAVVAGAAPTDLTQLDDPWAASVVAIFLGHILSPESRALYREASPVHHVSADDAPFLFVHGIADGTVSFRNSKLMQTALRDAGVEAEMIQIEPGGHGALFRSDVIRPIIAWLNRQLLDSAAARELEGLLVAFERIAAGEALARAGNVHAALKSYEQALRESDRVTISGSSWNRVCWSGSLHGQAGAALAACERALELAPWNPGFRDSRGLARALTGDIAGAISDFEYFVSSMDSSSPAVAQRQSWIAELRAGRNPFTPDVLERLRW